MTAELVTQWLGRTAAAGAVVLLACWLACRLTGQPARRQRLGEWGVTAALIVALVALQPGWLPLPLLPAEPPGDPVAAGSTGVAVVTPSESHTLDELPSASIDEFADEFVEEPIEVLVIAEKPATPAVEPVAPAVTAEDRTGDWRLLALAVWAAGACYFLGRLLLGSWALARYRRRALPVPEHVAQAFAALARPGARVLMVPGLAVPLSFGLWRPTVLLPAGLCAPGAEARLRLVLAHETAHLRRRDAWTSLLFGLAQPLFWFVPWFWWLRDQVRLCQEYLADEATVRACGERPEDYADFLLRWARRARVPVGAHGAWGHTSDLSRRIVMLVNRSHHLESACPRRWSWLAGVSLLALAVLLAGVNLTAQAAPGAFDDPAPAKQEPKKEEPQKEEPKKEEPKKGNDLFPNIDDIIKGLPEGLDPRTIQMIKDQLQAAQKAFDQLQKQMPNGPNALPGIRQLPGIQIRPIGGVRRLPAPVIDGRFGTRLDKPSDAIVDQLDLPKDQGLVVGDVPAESAAAKAGLKAHDILLEVDGKKVPSDLGEFQKQLKDVKPDTAVDVVVLRKNKKETVKGVKLPEAKEQPAAPRRPGLRLPNLPGIGGAGGGGGIQIIGNGQARVVSVQRNGNNYTATEKTGNTTVTVKGSVVMGVASVDSVEVKEGNVASTFPSIENVPEKHREQARKLADMATGGKLLKKPEPPKEEKKPDQ